MVAPNEQVYTTIRVKVDTKQRLEQLAARLTLKDGEKRHADDAAEFAIESAEKELKKQEGKK